MGSQAPPLPKEHVVSCRYQLSAEFYRISTGVTADVQGVARLVPARAGTIGERDGEARCDGGCSTGTLAKAPARPASAGSTWTLLPRLPPGPNRNPQQ
jgi:hypothetical protein